MFSRDFFSFCFCEGYFALITSLQLIIISLGMIRVIITLNYLETNIPLFLCMSLDTLVSVESSVR